MGDAGESRGRWLIGLLVGLVCSLLGIGVELYKFSRELVIGNNHHEVALYRDLEKEFYGDSQGFREIRMAIERCQPLYKSWNGSFDNDQINSYLGFFEDLGFYFNRGVLSIEVINHGFGAYIIEAFEYEELKRYVREMRQTAKQPEAFKDFEGLARTLESNFSLNSEIAVARAACRDSAQPHKLSQGMPAEEKVK